MTQAGYVLTGGRSSRFGSDKARFEIDGRPLAWVTAEKVCQAAGSVALVGAPERYADWDLRLIADPREDFGPVAGIVAALEDSHADWNLIVAVDMVGVTVEFLRFLLEGADADVVMPVQPDGRDQPLCCAYRTDVAGALRARMDAGIGRVTDALEAVRVRRVLPEEYARFGGAELFENLNRPG
ncbi:MAG: molybdenum cofactor guanylyltransferase [Bryobacterales bacterium]|nr:molybdenum cofactor guanylyltransferase [Bryobacterales bacterium]